MAEDLIHRYATAEDVAKAVADAFVAFTTACIKQTETCVVAISGGTTPNALFELLNTEEYRKKVDWENIYFLWVDERFVPHSDPDNNFHRAKERLFGNLGCSCHFYPVPTNNGTVEEAAAAYEKEVRTVLNACEKTELDLVLLGLGDDGHTASLFPKSSVLQEQDHIVVAVKDGKVWNVDVGKACVVYGCRRFKGSSTGSRLPATTRLCGRIVAGSNRSCIARSGIDTGYRGVVRG